MFTVIGWCLCAAAAIGALVLYLDRLDLRDQLKWAREDAERWEKEAKALGWKNPFEEVAESLNKTVDQLRKVAEVMARTRAVQAETTAKLKKLAETCKEVNARMRSQNEALADAKRKLDGIGRPPRVDPPEPAAPAKDDPSRSVSDGDVVAGQLSWAAPPKLLN